LARLLSRAFTAFTLGILLCACAAAAGDAGTPWVLPFDPDGPNGCATISTPFSVANPWDHAHEGLDFACIPGTTVLAVAQGSVTSVERVEVRGETRYRVFVSIADDAIRVEYVNLRALSVDLADDLRAGDPVGASALGLHIAVWSETEGRYIDPGQVLPLDALPDAP
jgi:hypothetical protein